MAHTIAPKAFDALASICASLIACDGHVDDSEVGGFLLAAEDLGMDMDAAQEVLEARLTELEGGTTVDQMLASGCSSLPASMRPLALETAVHILLADGEFSATEMVRLASLRQLLDLSEEMLLMLVAREANAAEELEVEAVTK